MEIVCDKCESKFKLSDDKIPAGKTVTLPCPNCKNKLSITSPQEVREAQEVEEEIPQEIEDMFGFNEDEEQDVGEYDVSDRPFDFVEEEGKTALICESELDIQKELATVLEVLEYHITVARNTRDALKKMRYQRYNIIIVNDRFDSEDPDKNGVLIYLERMNMVERRDVFVTLISERFRTMDNITAFQKSVNIILNKNNIDDFDRILRRGIADNDMFYRVFKEKME